MTALPDLYLLSILQATAASMLLRLIVMVGVRKPFSMLQASRDDDHLQLLVAGQRRIDFFQGWHDRSGFPVLCRLPPCGVTFDETLCRE